MIRPTRAAAALAAAAVTFAVGAGGASAAPAINGKIPYDDTFPEITDCSGNPITLHGTQHFVIHGDFSDSGQEKVMQHVNQQGVYGVGADGTIYRFVQTLNFNQEASDGSANTTTIETTLNYISQGDTPNTSFHVVLHTTFNANGEPTSNVYNYHVDCELPE